MSTFDEAVRASDDDTVQRMVKHGIPVTRENYIEMAYLGDPPQEWNVDLEETLPEFLRTGWQG